MGVSTTIVVTPAIERQLLTIKQVHGIVRDQYATKADEASRIMAVALLDYVAESALKTLLWNLPSRKPKPKKDPNFPDLWQTVDDLSGDAPLPLKFEIMSLHDLRRLTQHRNAVPSSEDVRDHTTHVAAFLRRVFSQFFGLNFDTLSLSALVTDGELRAHLEAAERLMANHQYVDAVGESALAVFKALRVRLPKLIRHSWFSPSSIRGFAEWHGAFSPQQAEFLEGLAKDLSNLMDEWDEKICVLAFGLDYRSYIRYKAFAPRLFWTMEGSIHVQHLKDDYTPDEAATAFDYALTHILGLESIGAVAAPSE